MKTNLMHYLSSIYFVNQPLHIPGVFLAHHKEVYYIYTIGTIVLFNWLSVVRIGIVGYKYARNM